MPAPTIEAPDESPEMTVCRMLMTTVWMYRDNPLIGSAAVAEHARLSQRFAKLKQEAAQSAQAQEPSAQPQAA